MASLDTIVLILGVFLGTTIAGIVANAMNDPSVLDGWRIRLDGERPRAKAADYEYVETLES